MPPAQLYAVPPGSSVSPYSLQAMQAAAAAKRPFEGVDEGGPEGQYWRFQEKKPRRDDQIPIRGQTLPSTNQSPMHPEEKVST